MNKVEHSGWIKKGCLFLASKGRFKGELQAFPDCDVTIIVKKKGKRSSPQNRYYWGIVVEEIKQELFRRGNRFDAEDIHEWLKLKFNPSKVVIEYTGEVLEIGGSTTEMNKEEFMNYIEKIREWAAMNLEITIPDPGQQTEMFAA